MNGRYFIVQETCSCMVRLIHILIADSNLGFRHLTKIENTRDEDLRVAKRGS